MNPQGEKEKQNRLVRGEGVNLTDSLFNEKQLEIFMGALSILILIVFSQGLYYFLGNFAFVIDCIAIIFLFPSGNNFYLWNVWKRLELSENIATQFLFFYFILIFIGLSAYVRPREFSLLAILTPVLIIYTWISTKLMKRIDFDTSRIQIMGALISAFLYVISYIDFGERSSYFIQIAPVFASVLLFPLTAAKWLTKNSSTME